MESNDKINNNENEHNNLKPSDFQDLTPKDDVDLTGYKEALDRAFDIKNNKIKNIAITGSYGSGKSSILNTYKKNSKLKFIHISFLHFKECDKDDTNICENKEESNDDKEKNKIYNEKFREEILERKIINHIINQIPFKYISDTNFNIRGNIGIPRAFSKAIFNLLSLGSFFYIIVSLTKIIIPNSISSNLEINPIFLIVSFIFIIAYLTMFFYKLNNKRVSGSIKFKNLELNMDKSKDSSSKYDSFFDSYLDEILYIFENCKKDVIVFEDIDRFEMSVIFERLREINILLNEKLKKKNKVIKFCYLVKDDIFTSKDRVKFFDFIIPVIPIMNGSNIYEIFLSYFKEFNINNHLINEVCKYISDIRMLQNIYNEFLIYNKKINKYLNPDYNQILSIVIYKNLFPKDFNDFNLNKGLLFNIFGNVLLKKEILEDIENKLEKLKEEYKNEINNINKYNLNNDENSFNNVVNYILYKIFNEELLISNARLDYCLYKFSDYYCKKNNISFNKDGNYNVNFLDYDGEIIAFTKLMEKESILIKLQYEILKLEYNYNCIENNKFNKLCYENINELEELFEKFKKDLYIQNKSHHEFIKVLVLNGFIDGSSKYYLADFNDKIFQKNDINFILNVVNGENKLSYNYKLSNIPLIVNFLDDYYYTTNNIFNFDLLDYLLDNLIGTTVYGTIDFKLDCFISKLIQMKNFEFVYTYYKRNIEYSKKLLDKLSYRRYKFDNINELVSYKSLFEEIVIKNLYEINADNLKVILEYYGYDSYDICHRNYYLIVKTNKLYNYIYRNIYKYLKTYIKICDGYIEDDEKYTINLVNAILFEIFKVYYNNNSIISYLDYFKKYLELLKIKISLIKGIKFFNTDVPLKKCIDYYEDNLFIKLYKIIFEYNVIGYFIENLFEYWLKIEEIDENIIKFINESSEEFKFYNKCSDYDIEDVRVFLNELKNDNRIKENKRIEIQSCIYELDKF